MVAGVAGRLGRSRPRTSILRLARAAGKGIGLVTTATITHATPAGFAAQVEARADEGIIAEQYLEVGVDVLLGGGAKGRPARSFWRLCPRGLPRGARCLRIEDPAAHANDIGGLLFDQIAFDDAVDVALALAAGRDDTLVAVTSDHGNANPGLNGAGGSFTNRGGSYGDTQACFDRVARFRQTNVWTLAGQIAHSVIGPVDSNSAWILASASGFHLSDRLSGRCSDVGFDGFALVAVDGLEHLPGDPKHAAHAGRAIGRPEAHLGRVLGGHVGGRQSEEEPERGGNQHTVDEDAFGGYVAGRGLVHGAVMGPDAGVWQTPAQALGG